MDIVHSIFFSFLITQFELEPNVLNYVNSIQCVQYRDCFAMHFFLCNYGFPPLSHSMLIANAWVGREWRHARIIFINFITGSYKIADNSENYDTELRFGKHFLPISLRNRVKSLFENVWGIQATISESHDDHHIQIKRFISNVDAIGNYFGDIAICAHFHISSINLLKIFVKNSLIHVHTPARTNTHDVCHSSTIFHKSHVQSPVFSVLRSLCSHSLSLSFTISLSLSLYLSELLDLSIILLPFPRCSHLCLFVRCEFSLAHTHTYRHTDGFSLCKCLFQ